MHFFGKVPCKTDFSGGRWPVGVFAHHAPALYVLPWKAAILERNSSVACRHIHVRPTSLKIGLKSSSEPSLTFSQSRVEPKMEKMSRIQAEREKADGIEVL